MYLKSFRTLCCFVSFSLLLFSCSEIKDENIYPSQESQSKDLGDELLSIDSANADKDLLLFLQKFSNFRLDQVEKMGTNYVFDRSFLLTEERLKSFLKEMGNTENKQLVKNIKYNDLRPPGNTQKISLRLYLDQALSSGATIYPEWSTPFFNSILEYNGLPNFLFNLNGFENVSINSNTGNPFFTNVSDGILVMSDTNDPAVNLASNVAGLAEYPLNGSFGKRIWINTDFNNQGTLNQKQRTKVITHEIGHTLGFMHKNEPNDGSGSLVSGVPSSDFMSVMNQGNPYYLAPLAGVLSPWDNIAFTEVYKQNRDLSHFYLYRRTNPERYFYTTSWNSLGLPNSNFPYSRPIGLIGRTQISGTVPLYHYINSTTGCYYYDTNQISGGGWQYLGIAGYVYPAANSAGKKPIYRYFRGGIHVYVDDFLNFAYQSDPNYVYIGVAFYLD